MAALLAPAQTASQRADSKSRSELRLVEPRARILSVSTDPADHAALRRIADPFRWRFASVNTCAAAIRELVRRRARVVFCESLLPDGTWKDLLEWMACLDAPARFAVIAGNADEHLWLEVLQRGGYDVLSKPLIDVEVWNVLGSVSGHPPRPAGRPQSVVPIR